MNRYKRNPLHQSIFSVAAKVRRMPGVTAIMNSTPLRGFVVLLFASIFFGVASDAQAQITLIQTKNGSTAGATSVSATYAPAPIQDHLLIAIIGTRDSVTINAPAGWSTARNESGAPGQAIFYKIAGAAEPAGVTVTVSASTALGLHIYEYSGNATTSPLDSAPAGMTGTDATLETATITTSNSNDLLIVGVVINDNNATISAYTNGFTERNDFAAGAGGNRSDFGGADRNNTSGVLPNNTTATATESGAWRSQIAAFKALVPTAVEFASFNSTRHGNVVVLEWQTGYEVNNLGFNIYREVAGKRTRVNSDIIAGSALLAGSGTVLRTGESYIWTDSLSKADQDAWYWLEDIDLKGTSTWRGPFAVSQATNDDGPVSKRERSTLLSSLSSGDPNARDTSLTRPVERTAKLSAIAIKPPSPTANLAAQSAVKISVKREGFYRVTQAELLAAGLSSSANPRNLQLFVDGQELPINVPGEQDEKFDPADAIEFYAYGLDTPSTDARVYWLIAGQTPGHRINKQQSQGGPGAGGQFLYTVERKDKTVYFAALKNGEDDNFFGSTVTSTPVNQVLNLQNVATENVKHADLEIVLQGVTDSAHQVKALFNGTEIGTINFTGQQKGTLQLQIEHSQLLEGDNTINLVAEGGSTDTSLVDRIRISYYHTLKADNNALKLKAQAGEQVTINGFASGNIRVIDVTDPNSVQEIAGIVDTDKTSFSVTASVTGAGERTLLAIDEGQIKQVAGIIANQPSKLRTTGQGADLIIIADKAFIPGLAPLKALRESQRLSVMVVDVVDVYDEFSNGHKTPQAVKDFLGYAKTSWKRKPQFALIAGDASFDPRNYLGLGSYDYVPTKLVETGFNETASDDWFVDFNDDSLPDFAIGRLPVRSSQETTALVTKIVNYDQSPRSEEVLLVADRNEGFDFEAASAELRQIVPAKYRINEVMRGSTDDETARNNVLEAVNRGQKIINYLGHGSTRVWGGNVLNANDAPDLTNSNQLSLIIAMTCLNGMFQHPSLESFAEAMLKAGQGGAVAVWASSGMTEPNGQKPVDKELIQQLFNSGNLTIGEATVRAKALTGNGDIRRTWILFGDPSARLR